LADLSTVLDPTDTSAPVRRAVRTWLAVQIAFAFRPEQACRALASRADPEALLREGPVAPHSERQLRRGVKQLARIRARLLPISSDAYPERLRRLVDAPPLLVVRGDPSALRAPAVAIVGARAATHYGRTVARNLAETLARAGLVVVSGLAVGVDAAAHEGALEAGGRTVAFQACGPDRVYPAVHRHLADRIARAGAVVSELPPGTPPRAPHFPLRNRLISASSLAVAVIEARRRSGSLITARHAADQGVDVFAVPGPITAPTSQGPNRLIQEGAMPLLTPADILEPLSRTLSLPLLELSSGSSALPSGPTAGREAAATDPSDGEVSAADGGTRPARDSKLARSILAVLRDTPMTRDQLAQKLERSLSDLALDLIRLELDGRVAEERDGRLRAVAPLGGSRL
jgi:DNA processing protein